MSKRSSPYVVNSGKGIDKNSRDSGKTSSSGSGGKGGMSSGSDGKGIDKNSRDSGNTSSSSSGGKGGMSGGKGGMQMTGADISLLNEDMLLVSLATCHIPQGVVHGEGEGGTVSNPKAMSKGGNPKSMSKGGTRLTAVQWMKLNRRRFHSEDELEQAWLMYSSCN